MQMSDGSSSNVKPSPSAKASVSFSQGVTLIAVLLLFLGVTFIAFTQSPRLITSQPPGFLERIVYPWETNSFKRLPIVIGNLNDVFVLPNSQLVWVVGDGGLILHSQDGGITWEQQFLPGRAAEKKAAAVPLSAEQFSLFPRAIAGVQENVGDNYSSVADEKGNRPAPPLNAQIRDAFSVTDTSSQSSLGDPPYDGRYLNLKYVHFSDANTGAIRDETPDSWDYWGTVDGGVTWQYQGSKVLLAEMARDNAMHSRLILLNHGLDADQFRTANDDIEMLENKVKQSWVAVGDKGVIRLINNDSKDWRDEKYTDSNFNAVEMLGDKSWILVGDDGVIAKSIDDGETWHPLSRGTFSWQGNAPVSAAKLLADKEDEEYRRFPAPWYWLVCCLMIVYGVSFFTRKPLDRTPQEKSITDLLAPDRPLRPGDPDPLGYNSIACGLSRFMRNPSTEPPLTLAITGVWGSGKSSLMNLLYHDLKKFAFTPVWFNAWHHQKGEQLLASLYANIRNQAVPKLFSCSQFIPVGIMFRINLLFRRGVKHWLTTVVLIGVFAASATYLFTHRESSSLSINKITEVLVTPGFSWETLLVALFGNVAPLMALLQTMRAFGLNPLNLMTAQGDRQAQGRVDPSARQQFAREFNEVAKSLSLGRMVIFIDDLDRCSKENVVDILEAINFLSVSGDCYIVLGMDETWVKICINEHFKEMSERNPDFADQYLEKMINIKVPVPQLSDADSSNLLALEFSDSDKQDSNSVVQVLRSVKSGFHPYRYFLLMVCVVILGGCFGFLLDLLIRPAPEPVPPQQVIATWDNIDINQVSMVGGSPNITLGVKDNAVSNASSSVSSTWELSLTASEKDLAKGIVIGKLGDAKTSASLVLKGKMPATAAEGTGDRKTDETASGSTASIFRVGQHDNAYSDYWLPLLAVILLALGVFAYSMKMPVRRPEDSVNFRQALEIWKPWILLNRQTPRAIKRYLNRVRYMAMRYRPEQEAQVAGLGVALLGLFRKHDLAAESAHQPDAQFEAKLVALSAIQAVDTPWATNVFDIGSVQVQDLHELLKNKFGESLASSDNANKLVQQLWDAIVRHRKHFGDSAISDTSEQEKMARILADMQVK